MPARPRAIAARSQRFTELFSLVVSGQIKLRSIDGWRKIAAVLK